MPEPLGGSGAASHPRVGPAFDLGQQPGAETGAHGGTDLATFDRPGQALPSVGKWITYGPGESGPSLSAEGIGTLLESARSHDPLAIPALDTGQAAALIAQFAPVWVVDTASNDDRIGAPGWGGGGTVLVETALPTVYHRLSYARFDGAVLHRVARRRADVTRAANANHVRTWPSLWRRVVPLRRASARRRRFTSPFLSRYAGIARSYSVR